MATLVKIKFSIHLWNLTRIYNFQNVWSSCWKQLTFWLSYWGCKVHLQQYGKWIFSLIHFLQMKIAMLELRIIAHLISLVLIAWSALYTSFHHIIILTTITPQYFSWSWSFHLITSCTSSISTFIPSLELRKLKCFESWISGQGRCW